MVLLFVHGFQAVQGGGAYPYAVGREYVMVISYFHLKYLLKSQISSSKINQFIYENSKSRRNRQNKHKQKVQKDYFKRQEDGSIGKTTFYKSKRTEFKSSAPIYKPGVVQHAYDSSVEEQKLVNPLSSFASQPRQSGEIPVNKHMSQRTKQHDDS